MSIPDAKGRIFFFLPSFNFFFLLSEMFKCLVNTEETQKKSDTWWKIKENGED